MTVDGVGFTAVSTHLESVSPVARRRQARELLDALPADRPVLLGGDLNSGPGTDTATYGLLTAEFGDAHADLVPEGEGPTCCQAGSLRNEESRLDRRIDALLYRGAVRPTAVGRVGHRPEDRVEVELDDGTGRIWPSDHAGVVGTFEVAESTSTPTRTPTPTGTPTGKPTRTPTPTDEPTPTMSTGAPTEAGTGTPVRDTTPTASPTDGTPVRTSDGAGPGMGIVAAVAGLSAATLARLRRD